MNDSSKLPPLREQAAALEAAEADAARKQQLLNDAEALIVRQREARKAAEAELREAQDKAIRFDLDQAGIESRERDAVELVELRAKLAEAEKREMNAMCVRCGSSWFVPKSPVPEDVALDAARYRWLREKCRSTNEHWGGRWSIVIEGPCPKSHDSEDDFDAAIDAAMQKEKNND
jgi:multidrug efflux pump subunit AcrA (membrane-fusion protein)